jgi:hypothetical protein
MKQQQLTVNYKFIKDSNNRNCNATGVELEITTKDVLNLNDLKDYETISKFINQCGFFKEDIEIKDEFDFNWINESKNHVYKPHKKSYNYYTNKLPAGNKTERLEIYCIEHIDKPFIVYIDYVVEFKQTLTINSFEEFYNFIVNSGYVDYKEKVFVAETDLDSVLLNEWLCKENHASYSCSGFCERNKYDSVKYFIDSELCHRSYCDKQPVTIPKIQIKNHCKFKMKHEYMVWVNE